MRKLLWLSAAALLSYACAPSAGSVADPADSSVPRDASLPNDGGVAPEADAASDPDAAAVADAAIDAPIADAASPANPRPCDIYAAGGTPCVAAHSTVRALYGAYDGPLYQVRRDSDKKTRDVGVVSAGGIADAASQDAFCAGTKCTIAILYDQSPKKNDMRSAPGGGAAPKADVEAVADAAPITIGGQKAYGIYVSAGTGYRIDKTAGIATGDDPEGAYMVASGKHYNGFCCFDYGNAETNNLDTGAGHMEAVYLGSAPDKDAGASAGPWVKGDLENGLFLSATRGQAGEHAVPFDFVTAMVKGEAGNHWAVESANAQAGDLTVVWDGARPAGYSPMHKEGAIVLGVGGDNSNRSIGTFYEGCMTAGYPSNATDALVQANIVAAAYGK